MLTTDSSLICNKFNGIKRISSSFSSGMISASDMQNVELFDTGINSGIGIRTMKGNTAVINLPNGEKIINIFESVQKAQTHCFIHSESETEGKIYLYNIDSNSLVLKADNLSLTGKSSGVNFAQGWSDLFIFSNGEELLSIELGKLDENFEPDEVTIIDTLDVEENKVKGLGLTVFDGRLWLFDGTRLLYSVKENCYDFATSSDGIYTSAGFIEFVKEITAIAPYLNGLAVFHKESSCIISINEDYSYSKSADSPGGCAGMDSLVFHGAQLYFYDYTKKSLFAFSQIINGDTTLVDNIAKDVQEELFSISANDLDKIKLISVVQPEHNEIWFLLPDNSELSTILIFDYLHLQWVKRKIKHIDAFAVINGELYSAGNNKVYQEYLGNDFDGEFIEAYYTCSPMNLSVDNTMKILYIPPRITMDMTQNNNFMLQYVRDYDYLKKVKIKKITTKTLKNIFRWDVSLWDNGDVWKPKNTDSIKRLPISSFKTLEMKFYTQEVEENAQAQGFAIKNIEFSRIKVKQL